MSRTPAQSRLRAHERYARFSDILRKAAQHLKSLWWDPRQSLPDLTDRQARDIGIDPAALEARRLRLPSRHSHHPRQ